MQEYDNEAELMVSHLSINHHDDEDIDLALKLAQVDIFTRRLRERARRKRVARDFQLIAQFFGNAKKEKPLPLPAAKKREAQKEKWVFRRLCQPKRWTRLYQLFWIQALLPAYPEMT